MNDAKIVSVRGTNGLLYNYYMKMVTVLDNRHYWSNTLNRECVWMQWESLSGNISALDRIKEIKGANVALILFERMDSVSDKYLIDGYLLIESDYPQFVTDTICKFYPIGMETEASNDDLGSVMFGNVNNATIQKCLDNWEKKCQNKAKKFIIIMTFDLVY